MMETVQKPSNSELHVSSLFITLGKKQFHLVFSPLFNCHKNYDSRRLRTEPKNISYFCAVEYTIPLPVDTMYTGHYSYTGLLGFDRLYSRRQIPTFRGTCCPLFRVEMCGMRIRVLWCLDVEPCLGSWPDCDVQHTPAGSLNSVPFLSWEKRSRWVDMLSVQ